MTNPILPPHQEASNDECTCFEVHGEDPKCVFHGTGTNWALENTQPFDWQSQVLEQAQIIADLEAKLAESEARLLARLGEDDVWVFIRLATLQAVMAIEKDTLIGELTDDEYKSIFTAQITAVIDRLKGEG